MALKSGYFRGNARIARAADNKPPMASGERGYPVALLQAGLIHLGYPLPISTKKSPGAPDGIFGGETKAAVSKFQSDQSLGVDGIAGRQTITRMDSLLPAGTAPLPKPPAPIPPAPKPPAPKPPAPKPPAPKPPGPGPVPPAPPSPPSTIPDDPVFKIGTDNPTIIPDEGSGAWNVKEYELKTLAAYTALNSDIFLDVASIAIGPNAVRHLKHYFKNTGTPLTIHFEDLLENVKSGQELFTFWVDRLKVYVEKLPVGQHFVTSKQAESTYNYKEQSKDWYYAVGGYSTWVKGAASITQTPSGRSCHFELEYRFYDRYNWDGGKSVTINVPLHGEVEVTDAEMQEFHKQGLAREYDEVGSVRRTLDWIAGTAIPPAQLKRGGGR